MEDIKTFSDLIKALKEQGYGSLTIDEVLEVLEKAKEETEKA